MIFDRLADGQDDLKEVTLKHLGKSFTSAPYMQYKLTLTLHPNPTPTEEFAGSGLRTLCVAIKEIPQRVYDEWSTKYNQAALQINGREAAVRPCSLLMFPLEC